LIDVDLYKPISAILPKVYNELTPGGVIVVDDCQPDTSFDGALVAYEEFIRERDLPSEIVCEKLGLIKR
jgi:hypothetical protein